MLGSALLRFPLAGTLAAAERLARDAHFDRETTPRAAVLLLQGDILWRLMPMCLDEVLECGLGIEAGAFLVELAEFGAKQAKNEAASGTVATAAVDGANDCFHGAGEVALAGAAPGGLFATAEDEVVAEAETGGGGGEGAATDDVGAHAGELALAGIGVAVEELGSYDHAKDGVAKEFEAFVGVGVGSGLVEVGSVGKGLLEEFRRKISDTEARGEFVEGR